MAGERNRVPPSLRDLARGLLERETGERQGPQELADGVERVVQKLRGHLAKLVGPAGFRAILARALSLARAEAPLLKGVEAEMQGESCLKGLSEAVQGRDPSEVQQGSAAVIAHFLWLLITFIGEDLSLRLVHAIWPEASPGETGSSSKEARE